MCPSYTWRDSEHEWIVITSVDSRNNPRACPTCGADGTRSEVEPFRIDKLCLTTGSGVSTEEYNPGLGCVTKSIKDAERIAKSRGLEPVGNEPPENLHKHFDRQREETREQRWRDADRVMVYGD